MADHVHAPQGNMSKGHGIMPSDIIPASVRRPTRGRAFSLANRVLPIYPVKNFNGDNTMHETQQFAQASILLLVLTAAAAFTADDFSLLLLTSGIFMLFFTYRSLSGEMTGRALVFQLLLSLAYALVSGNIAGYLIFFEFRPYAWERWFRFLRPGLSSAAYLTAFFTAPCLAPLMTETGRSGLPRALLNALLLLAAALGLVLCERLTVSYLSAKNETARVVSITALAELYEKKLNQELVMKNYLADKTARLEERENISRNIHNSVGHSVTAAIVALDAAELLLTTDTERAREKIRAANRRIRTGLDSIRQAVRILDEEESLLPVGDFVGSLRELAEGFMMDTALKIRMDVFDYSPGLLLPHEYGVFLHGAVSELLTNGIRHGSADCFTVHFAADSAHIRVCVKDNGISDFSPQNSPARIENGYGLKKIRSFAEKCGGSAVFENNRGFQCMITLPLYREKGAEDG